MALQNHEVFHKYFVQLCREVKTVPFAFKLLKKKFISTSLCETLVCSEGHQSLNNAKLFLNLHNRCEMEEFLQCLREAGHSDIANDMADDILRDTKVPRTTPHMCIMTYRDNAMEKFADRIKLKIHNAEVENFKAYIRSFMTKFLVNLSENALGCEERKMADFCFILLDSLIVLDRTHSENRSILYQKEEFSHMNKIIMKTSNPTLTRVRYLMRYAIALAQGGKTEHALRHLQSAREDAHLYFPGKDMGNCLFAIVNTKLQIYALTKSKRLKREILELVEEAVRYFENEDEDVLLNWRRIYWIKKAYCYLAIDSLGWDIMGVPITIEDQADAAECLIALEKLSIGMDLRRKMHLYRAKAKLHSIKGEQCIANGYLRQALALADEGGFRADLKIIKYLIEPNLQTHDSGGEWSSLGRCPTEHDESDPLYISEQFRLGSCHLTEHDLEFTEESVEKKELEPDRCESLICDTQTLPDTVGMVSTGLVAISRILNIEHGTSDNT